KDKNNTPLNPLSRGEFKNYFFEKLGGGKIYLLRLTTRYEEIMIINKSRRDDMIIEKNNTPLNPLSRGEFKNHSFEKWVLGGYGVSEYDTGSLIWIY
ncbi:MAG: hypothetical protein QG635_1422, partial [Bacteroidota bacterium]|nr:hypothetical protein [Bacteroidota bacterium]